jgi:hypothetical protein
MKLCYVNTLPCPESKVSAIVRPLVGSENRIPYYNRSDEDHVCFSPNAHMKVRLRGQ